MLSTSGYTTSSQMGARARLVNNLLALLLSVGLLGFAAAALAQAPARPLRIVALGDSLSAGFGLKPGEAFPDQLQRLLAAKGHQVEITNAGVSGDTTAGGLARLDWAVPEGTDAVILELGANDALSGKPPAQARRNLEAIVQQLKARRIDVLMAGMRAPRSLGNDYANAFDAIFPELAEKHGLIFYPFFLTGVALDPKLNLADGIHPTAKGIGIIAERMLPVAEQLIGRIKARAPAAPKG